MFTLHVAFIMFGVSCWKWCQKLLFSRPFHVRRSCSMYNHVRHMYQLVCCMFNLWCCMFNFHFAYFMLFFSCKFHASYLQYYVESLKFVASCHKNGAKKIYIHVSCTTSFVTYNKYCCKFTSFSCLIVVWCFKS